MISLKGALEKDSTLKVGSNRDQQIVSPWNIKTKYSLKFFLGKRVVGLPRWRKAREIGNKSHNFRNILQSNKRKSRGDPLLQDTGSGKTTSLSASPFPPLLELDHLDPVQLEKANVLDNSVSQKGNEKS